MHRIDTKTAQKDKFGAGKNGFTRGNPQTGTPATDLDDDYFDMLQEELCSVVEASGASLEKARHDQLLTALRALLLSRKNPFGDIKSDGTVKTALENLGLGEGSALPVGVPVPWPSATPPTGWLKCNGAPFSAEEYPKLAKAYPKLKLPDLRGEFIRGWDDGRGVDSARLLLSSQAASILEHNHEMHGWTGNPLMARDVYSSGSSVFAVQLSIGDGGLLYSWKDGSGTTNDSKRMDRTNHVSSGAGDGSPRNIAFNYIVRAA
ncbi:phage tail protein [Escherichia albertii]|uniref:phage tail protein n=1 Tax=Escherichia albertii TaxID=208962 RepID=UPI00211A5633|nr:phage tail protein [Escherichia albertii]MDM8919418.1 phage tail protein [Escherichia coli]MCQ8916791.1 phage tail protein [Escherichia albertii]MCQ8925538.1 phage tail protein [Escherichia albertii]MCQ8949377.1 phage tail protein [Escherichia albertii]MCQ8961421.1 phage tail protein [Escherichia albertii]